MKILIIKKLQSNFLGKICTILTKPIAKRDFSDHQFADFFTGVIDEIDDDGIFTTHTLTGCKNFYRMSEVIGIIEEQVLNDEDPKHQKIITELKEKQGKKDDKDNDNDDTNKQKFIDIDDLSGLTGFDKEEET
jgi:hypothetical protein